MDVRMDVRDGFGVETSARPLRHIVHTCVYGRADGRAGTSIVGCCYGCRRADGRADGRATHLDTKMMDVRMDVRTCVGHENSTHVTLDIHSGNVNSDSSAPKFE